MVYVLRAGDRYIRSTKPLGDEIWSMAEWLDYVGSR